MALFPACRQAVITMLPALALLALAAVPQDEMLSLPGWDGALPSRQYSGYLDVGPNNRKHLHYWLVESTGPDPHAKDTPIVLWLNGGPGCSSLDGWYYEHGPFRGSEADPTKLVRNPSTWDTLGNIVYLEAPVGVGFSYSDEPDTDYKCNDDSTSQDSMQAMNQFFEKYPEYKDHPFYIAGESYGGVYVPTLAEAILWSAGNGTWKGAKLEGIAVGNGCTGSEIGTCSAEADKYRGMYLVEQGFTPSTLKVQIRKACDWDAISDECHGLLEQMYGLLEDIDLYDIYGECLNSIGEAQDGAARLKAPLGNFRRGAAANGEGPTACLNSFGGTAYFSQASIPNATHVKPIDFKWATCATADGWDYTSTRPNLPRDTYPYLLQHIRVMIYNGDWDACVPYVDNEEWTRNMGYAVDAAWHPWSYQVQSQRQVGGYATYYKAPKDFSFVTVKGGRHEVPETAGDKARVIIDRFMQNERL